MPVRSAIASEVSKIVRTLQRKPTDGNDTDRAERRFQMKVNAPETLRDRDVDWRGTNRLDRSRRVNPIRPGTGEHFNRPGIRWGLKINPVSAGSNQFAGG